MQEVEGKPVEDMTGNLCLLLHLNDPPRLQTA